MKKKSNAFNIFVSGIDIKLKIHNYKNRKPEEKEYDFDDWCRVDYRFKGKDQLKETKSEKVWLNYKGKNKEILLSSEIRALKINLDKLLNDELKTKRHLSMIEPDFEFVLYPKKEIKAAKDKEDSEDKPKEYIDIQLEWIVNFWYCGGLTANTLSISLDRDDIVKLRDYLDRVISEDKQ